MYIYKRDIKDCQVVTMEEDWEWRSEPADVAEAPAVEMAMKVLCHDPKVCAVD